MVDVPSNYSLVLGRSSTYAMCTIPSSIFRVLVFPHEGKLVIVDKLSYTRNGHLETIDSTIPLIDQSKLSNEILGVGKYTSLMGTFDIPAPITTGSKSAGMSISRVVDRNDP